MWGGVASVSRLHSQELIFLRNNRIGDPKDMILQIQKAILD